MKILVCIRQGLDGEINPFDACAYEEALRVTGAEVTIISMGPQSAKDFLLRLTRLGAKRAILLSDKAFAGADTLATAYTLSLAVKKLQPDLIFCGRQTLVGDTAQTGPMLSILAKTSLITNVMGIEEIGENITCATRDNGSETVSLPALLTVERINNLRLPSIRSKMGEVEVWSASDIGADIDRCGLTGSPTRVIKTFENESGKRKCKFISKEELSQVITNALQKRNDAIIKTVSNTQKLDKVFIIGEGPRPFAETISDDITVLPLTNAADLAQKITELSPNAVLWGSDSISKKVSAQVSAMLNLGLCADCTLLETDGEELYMYRPALSGSVIAKIVSRTKPAMATVRTTDGGADIMVAAGYGVKDSIDIVRSFAERYSAEMVTTRKAVDNDILPYNMQVGLTGKTVSPLVYIAVGVSGAVHHIAGMQKSGTIIAINPDKDAQIFDYADYGIVANIEDIF